MTKQSELIAALETLGYERAPDQKTRKYVVFKNKGGRGFLYVGSQGALRVGGPLSNTFGATESYKKRLLQEAEDRRQTIVVMKDAPRE